ncbi:hypothetical protein PV783_27380 [Chitinophaga sp. CC14]|uniref:hypothetical protein n=1 Tax=Chitinophaga sp. CC14 TaxID=3029199 RepID=UPI003B7F4C84
MALGVKKIFRLLFGLLCFCLSSFCALIVLMNIITIHKGSIGVDFRMSTNTALVMCFYVIASAFFLWRGVRLMKPPKKKEEKTELLGEEF